MMVLSTGLDVSAFWDSLRRRGNRALLLDYDGTLAPFRVERSEAVPYPGVREILEEITANAACRVVVISGRSVEDLIPLLGLRVIPEVWGAHGRERLFPDGTYQVVPISAEADKVLRMALDWAKASGLERHCESKPGCVALHVRGFEPERAKQVLKQVRSAWSLLDEGHGLDLHSFDGGVELRAKGCHKGQAVETIFQESGPETVAAYLGDDITDEDAFRALKDKGLGVLVRSELRPTEADLWIRPPGELLQFLSEWADICGAKLQEKIEPRINTNGHE